MKIPKFLRNLLQSNNYWNKNSAEFVKANEYLEKLFPGGYVMTGLSNRRNEEWNMFNN